MDGTLEVRLLGTPLMRIVNGQGPALQEGRVEHIGDVSLLSAGWRERKPDAEAVREWLEHLIPEGEASTVYRERAQHFLKMHGEANVREPDVAARIWGNADREYAGGVSFRALDGDGGKSNGTPRRWKPTAAGSTSRTRYAGPTTKSRTAGGTWTGIRSSGRRL